jgi:hypothetical protein
VPDQSGGQYCIPIPLVDRLISKAHGSEQMEARQSYQNLRQRLVALKPGH